MGDRTKTIKIRVTPDEKREYEEYIAETGEAPSTSSWFRTLANERVSDDDEATADIDLESLTEAMEVALSDRNRSTTASSNWYGLPSYSFTISSTTASSDSSSYS